MTETSSAIYKAENGELTTPPQVVNPVGIYEEDELEFATEEEVKELASQGLLSVEASLSNKAQGDYDRSYLYHRWLNVYDSAQFAWKVPLTKEQVEQGLKNVELGSKSREMIHAVRGVIVSVNGGHELSIYDNSTNRTIMHCRTTGATVMNANGVSQVYKGTRPLPTVWERPHMGAKRSNELGFFMQKNPHITLHASRFVNAEAEEGEQNYRQSTEDNCRDCILAGRNSVLDKDGKPVFCKAKGHILFAVFYVGVRNDKLHDEDDCENPIQIDWVPIQDAGLKRFDGEPLNKPFIIRLEGLSNQMSKIGNGQYDLNPRLPEHYRPGEQKDYYLPENQKPYSFKELMEWFNAPEGYGSRLRVTKKGKFVYTSLVDIYSAPRIKAVAASKYIPLFYPVEADEAGKFDGISVLEFVDAGRRAALEERDMVEKGLSQPESKKLNGNGKTNGNGKSNGNGNGTSEAVEAKPVEEEIKINPSLEKTTTSSLKDKVSSAYSGI